MLFMDSLPAWAVFVATFAWIGLALEVGYRIGTRRHKNGVTRSEGSGAMVAATMGLLAFMLAFTFNWASNRHDARKALVTKEASAIHVAYMRATALTPDDRRLAEQTLRAYVELRLKAANEEMTLGQAIPETERIHQQLWEIAQRGPKGDGSAMASALFMQAVNEVVAVHLERLAVSVRQRVAPMIWTVLYGLALVGMLMTGALNGISQTRHVAFEMAFALAFSMVLFLIADLDRPQEGLVNVNQAAMTELRDRISIR